MAHWTFLTNHAQVLLCVTRNNRQTAREIAATVGVTEHAVQRILDDLEEAGCLRRFRDGRINRYERIPTCPCATPLSRAAPSTTC